MNAGVKFIIAVLLLFAFFVGGFCLGRYDIPQEMFESSYWDGYEDGYSDAEYSIAAQHGEGAAS